MEKSKEKIKYISELLSTKELGLLPGALAYSLFFAIIPVLSILFYFSTSINVSFEFIMDILRKIFPESGVKLLQPVLIQDFSLSSVITLVCGFFVAVNGFNLVIIASNEIYKLDNSPFINRMLKALLITLIMLVLLAFMLVVPLFGNSILKIILSFGTIFKEKETIITLIFNIGKIPFSLLVMYILVKLIYFIAPDQKMVFKSVTKGSIFTTVSWLIVSAIFSYYINNIARFDLVYGNLANIIIIMLWFYTLAYILIVGMVINKENVVDSIEKTNAIKLEEIRNKVKNSK